MSPTVELLIAIGKQVLAVIAKAILDNGGTKEDLARLKIENLAEIERVGAFEAEVKKRVKEILDKIPTPAEPADEEAKAIDEAG